MQLQTALREWPVDTEAQLRANLEALDDRDEFAILSTAPEHYMQTAMQSGGFIIEKREGSEAKHFHARRTSEQSDKPVGAEEDKERSWFSRLFGSQSNTAVADRTFTREEMVEVLVAYYLQQPSPAFLKWSEGY